MMRIPIDNSTLGYVVRTPFDKVSDSVKFKRQPEHLPTDKELMTFGEFKTKYNTDNTWTFTHTKEWEETLKQLKEMFKDFKFVLPTY